MKYDLAKKLKEAGFPQDIKAGNSYYEFVGHPRVGVPYQQAINVSFIDEPKDLRGKENIVKIPSLEELIEACGDRFLALSRYKKIDGSIEWGACVTNKEQIGESPEEAVANLWLVLNEK